MTLSKPPFLMFLAAALLTLLLSLISGLMGVPQGDKAANVRPADGAIAQQAAPAPATVTRPAPWAASAPGRVEPKGGEVRLTAQSPGRVIEVPVKVNDVVQAGDLLLRTDDEDARARLAAADAEAAVRRRERDAEAGSNKQATDRRQAEDTLATSERAVLTARAELDRVMRAQRAGTASAADLEKERANLKTALEKAEQEAVALRRAQAAQGVPLPTRLEAGLTAARSDVSLAENALERTRMRAPSAGTILQVNARVGETVAASPEQVLIVLGDVSALRVRAEIEERDVSKIRVGQSVVLKSDAFPGREFTGKVASRAQALGPARLSQKGPRRPTDVDTLEVMVDVDAGSPLLPGMRVDAFFRAETAPAAAAQPASEAAKK